MDNKIYDAANAYLQAGLCALPAIRAEKRPAVGRWKQYQKTLPSQAEMSAWMSNNPDAVCIVCGQASGNLEAIDFDAAGELYPAWQNRIPKDIRDKLVIETTPSGGLHVIYRCECAISGNLKLAQRNTGDKTETLIETRGEGGLILCAPTAGYEITQGDMCRPPLLTEAARETLLQAAWDLNEYWPKVVDGPNTSANVGQVEPLSEPHSDNGNCATDHSHNGNPHADDYNHRGDVQNVLEQFGWVRTKGGDNEYWRRPGKEKGSSATLKDRIFYVFSSNATPFESGRGYSPFAVYTLLNHGGNYSAASRALSALGFGQDDFLRTDVDISGIVGISVENANCATDSADNGDSRPENPDPGEIPEHLFHVPGLVTQIMDFTLAHAPYPNLGLAFCGAIALQSYLCGRKVRTKGDLRPNIYLLALASSGTGKDFPRKVNSRVLFEIGQVAALGDKFASGEGIQDALMRSNAMLFQNDEMDGVLRQINLDRENKRESIPNILLTLFTSASDIYPVRVKAGQKEAAHIDQPHLTLFGTATPRFFYESLSQRMLTNGLFARMMIVDIGKRGRGQEPGSARDLPEDIIDAAKWWNEFTPGTRKSGNLYELHPEPRIVPFTHDAEQSVEHLQRMGEDEYDRADTSGDEVGKTVWSRTCENAKKLALIYACSEDHEEPVIGTSAVEWATAFAMHQTRRQLYLASTYVAENPFHAECLKVIRTLKESRGQMARRKLMRLMRCKAADFDQIIGTLIQQGDIQPVDIHTKTKPAQGYKVTT